MKHILKLRIFSLFIFLLGLTLSLKVAMSEPITGTYRGKIEASLFFVKSLGVDQSSFTLTVWDSTNLNPINTSRGARRGCENLLDNFLQHLFHSYPLIENQLLPQVGDNPLRARMTISVQLHLQGSRALPCEGDKITPRMTFCLIPDGSSRGGTRGKRCPRHATKQGDILIEPRSFWNWFGDEIVVDFNDPNNYLDT